MTPTRSGSNYSIQSNGSVPGHFSHKAKGQECQPRGDKQMEDSRTSTSCKRYTSLSTRAGLWRQSSKSGTSPKSLDRHHELISSSEEAHGARKDRRTSQGLDTHVLQKTSPTDKSLVEKPKHVIRRPEEEVGPREVKKPSGSSPSLHKQQSTSTSAKKAQENPKDQPEGQSKGKAQVEHTLPAELQDSQ
ncbi:hypothetical protein O181_047067 [Austropuccinia psidii MF-1]|uniref:Uncharacterized protein n=1 Tax=Austropuccinia psidii MF-1 TaxID=1389203 RepID=A0A9Q3DSH2_9BASI|nr:hypothetical protein [Austropuccinia psidii MF-1]